MIAEAPSAKPGTDILGVLAWCEEQAQNIMGVTAGCATTHGDPGGGLEMANAYASDIAANLSMLAEALAGARS